jgi:hypothetical protein
VSKFAKQHGVTEYCYATWGRRFLPFPAELPDNLHGKALL